MDGVERRFTNTHTLTDKRSDGQTQRQANAATDKRGARPFQATSVILFLVFAFILSCKNLQT
jgi:hypothetical protein